MIEPYDAERLKGLIERLNCNTFSHPAYGETRKSIIETDAERRQAATALAAQAEEIERLRKNLETRDKFIVNTGRWQDFVDGLPSNTIPGGKQDD